jgi:hypothetical protein
LETLHDVLRFLTLIAFILLAIVGSWQWIKRRDAPTKWLALTFLSIGLVSLAALFTPEGDRSETIEWLVRAEILLLIFFPYLLFRFTATFGGVSRGTELIASGLIGVVAVWTLLLPEIPAEGEETPTSFLYYTYAIIIMWTLLSSIVTWRLWRAGRGQSPLARRRMRLLSLASALLSVAILISGAAPGDDSGPAQIAIQVIALLSVFTFYFGFSTPPGLRAAWRRPSEEALRRAVSELMTAETEQQVADAWFPHVTDIVAAKAVIAMRNDGTIIGSHGVDGEMLAELTRLLDQGRDTGSNIVHLTFPFGTMTVWASPYTPFFGRDEVELIESLGALANLAFERVHTVELKQQLSRAQMRRQQALEINDNVVQGLTVAKLAFDLGDREKAMKALQETLVSARGIITRLLQDLEETDQIQPGQLVRESAASVGKRGSSEA